MSIQDQLRSLTQNEKAVLYYKCKGFKRKAIAVKLRYSEDWVQLQMGGVYTKLGFKTEMHWTQRVGILNNEICPFIPKKLDEWLEIKVETTEENRDEFKPVIVEPHREPNPDPVMMALVLYDEKMIEESDSEKSVVKKEPKTITILPPPPKQSCLTRILWSVLLFGVAAVIGYGAYIFGRNSVPQLAPQVQVVTATFLPTAIESPTAILTSTPFPTPTFTPEPTFTPLPTATEFIPPADGILFQDDFESGDLSAWTQVNGQWLVANGELTVLSDDNDSYKWIALKRPEWKNYVLSLNVYQPHQGAAIQTDVLVAVRNNGSQKKYLGVPVDNFGKVYWAFIGNDIFDNDVVAGNKFDFESGSNMELEMQGNTYILRVNGRELQKITMAGYDSGGISLGAACDSGWDCARFDNVKITYLP